MTSRLHNLPAWLFHQARWFVRDRFPNRKVVREVQGVRMTLPWPHRLPDYAGNGTYGQNLVELAERLAEAEAPVKVMDVGANVGDSALQILHAADARVLCVEADPYYLEYLHLNVGSDERVSIEEALLATSSTHAGATTAVRSGGTTRFTGGVAADARPAVTTAELRERHQDFAALRLVKSDTDGYDVALVPMIAQEWRDSRPVLFFEYDHQLSRVAGNDPLAVWPRLQELGYRDVAVWDNGGVALGRTTVDEIAGKTAPLDGAGGRARRYWDVAVVHADDEAGQAALDALIPVSRAL